MAKVFEHIPFLKVFEPLLKGVGKLGGWIEKGLGKIFGPIGRGIAKGFKDAFPAAAGIARDLLERFVMGPARRLRTAAGLIPRAVGSGIESASAWLTKKILDFTKVIVRPFARAGSWLLGKGADLARGFGSGVARGGRAIGSFAKTWIIDPVIHGFSRAGTWLLSKGRSLVSGFKSGVSKVASGIGGWVFDHILAPIARWMARSGSWLIGKGRSLVSGFKSGIGAGAKAIGTWTTSHIVSPVLGRFGKAGSWLFEKGGALVSGLKDGVVDKVKTIGDWVKKSFVDPIVGWVRKHFGINSPSKVFIGIGKSLTKGLVMGMAKTHPKEIAEKVFGSLPKALGGFIKHGLISAKHLGSKALKALGGLGGDALSFLGLGGSGGGSSANQQIGQVLAAARGWSGPQWAALKNLWNGESGWNEKALNKSSGAYGIPQSLPASKMASAGGDWKTNAATQIKWGLSYIAERYDNPLNAYSQWLSRSPHWYAKGTDGATKGLAWVGERGPELVNFKGGEDVLSHPQSMAFAKANGIKLPGYASGTITNAADRVRRDHQRVQDAKDDGARQAATQGRPGGRDPPPGGTEGTRRGEHRAEERATVGEDVDRQHDRHRAPEDAEHGHVVVYRIGDQEPGHEVAERGL